MTRSIQDLRRQIGMVRARRHAPVDTFKQHRQLRWRQGYATGRCLWPDKATAFEPLAQQQQTLTIEPQHFEDVAAPTSKDKDVPTEWVLAQGPLDHRRQAVEALAHVGVAGHDPHPRVCWQTDQVVSQ